MIKNIKPKHNITKVALYEMLLDQDASDDFFGLTQESIDKIYNYLGTTDIIMIYSTDLHPEEMYDADSYGEWEYLELSAQEGYAPDYYETGTIILNGKEIKAICTQNASPIAFIVDRKETLEVEVLA